MFGFAEKVEEKSLGFMKAHPKFTKNVIAGTTALATIGSSVVVASADDESAASGDVVDTVVDTMKESMLGYAPKIIGAGLAVGLVFFAASLAIKWIKKMSK